jgi:indole-3-glycerol phosphate synthase
MAEYTRREIRKLKPEIVARLHDAAKKRDVQAFKRFLDEFAGELSLQRTAELIAEFKRYADEWSAARRR